MPINLIFPLTRNIAACHFGRMNGAELSPSENAQHEKGKSPLRGASKNRRKGPFVGIIPYDVEQQMFAAYCQIPTVSHVSRSCGVSIHTVRKYCREQHWEDRRLEIIRKAREAADYNLQTATEQSLLMVRALKQKVAEKIKSLSAKEMSTDNLVTDMDRLVKLEQILLGGVSDRSERISETHEQRIKRLREERERNITPDQAKRALGA